MTGDEIDTDLAVDSGGSGHPVIDVVVVAALAGTVVAMGHFLVPDLLFSAAMALTGLVVGHLLVSWHWPTDRTFFGRAPSVTIQAVTVLPLFGLSVLWLTTRSALSVRSIGFALFASVSIFLLGGSLAGYRVSDLLTGTRQFSLWFLVVLSVGTLTFAWTVIFVGLSPLTYLVFVEFGVLAVYLLFIVPIASYQGRRSVEESDLDPPFPEVSIVVPSYDEEGYVGRCIESLLSAGYPTDRLEIIVVDDGSSDDTYGEAASYRDRGVKVYHRENGGRYAAVNYGLFCASSEYVVVIDADSVLVEGALTKIVATLESNPSFGGVAGNIKVGNRDRILTRLQAIGYLMGIHTFRRAFSVFGSVPIVPGCLGGFRREALEEIGAYSPDTITEDFDLTVGLIKHGWEVRQINATALTEAPFTLRDLYRQRIRWYSGAFENFMKHSDLLFEDDSGYLHRIVFPIFMFRMLLLPFSHLVILGAFAAMLLGGNYLTVLAFLGVLMVTQVLISGLVVSLGDDDYGLLPYGVLMIYGYKQLLAAVMLVSLVRTLILRRDPGWEPLSRRNQIGAVEGQPDDGT